MRGQTLAPREKRELAVLAALPDHQIDTSDIPELPPGAWKEAIRGPILPCPIFEKTHKENHSRSLLGGLPRSISE
jgi:hypothetical protein